MSSILTNASAMVALQTLKGVNSSLETTQNMISTGKAISNAKDSSSIWAISKVMESDVKGFMAISESLSLGESTVAVAREGSETITDLLTAIKGKVVAAQEENVDRAKIQDDISALRDQITSVVNAAQFNGLNLLKGTDDVNILASLDRASDGTVSDSDITVARQDLTTGAGSFGATGETAASYGTINGATASDFTSDAGGKIAEITFAAATGAESFSINIGGATLSYSTSGAEAVGNIRDYFVGEINALGLAGVEAVSNGADAIDLTNTNAFETVAVTLSSTVDASLEITDLNGDGAPTDADVGTIEQRASTVNFSTTANVKEGDSFKVTAGGGSYDYIAGKNETMEDVARGLKTAIDGSNPDGITTRVQYDATSSQWKLAVDDANGDGSSTTFSLQVSSGGTASGGLFGLDNLDVTTTAGADSALSNIETLIDNAIDASASFGSAQARVETQTSFISALTDSLKVGIGTLVDAEMEEASARLQALQVQQQLATTALSIANSTPQNILALFR